jgi:hypothetical protein
MVQILRAGFLLPLCGLGTINGSTGETEPTALLRTAGLASDVISAAAPGWQHGSYEINA